MDDNNQSSKVRASELLVNNACIEVENLRSAIYEYELKTISNLQFINGGGVAVLVGFLSQAPIQNSNARCYFVFSIILFLAGLVFATILSFISPRFLEARYRQSEKSDEHKKLNIYRHICLFASLGCFSIAILFSLCGWLQ